MQKAAGKHYPHQTEKNCYGGSNNQNRFNVSRTDTAEQVQRIGSAFDLHAVLCRIGEQILNDALRLEIDLCFS